MATVAPLRRQREIVIERLSEHFALDHLDVEEFEHRVDAAHRAPSREQLAALTADLEPLDAVHERQVRAALTRRETLPPPDVMRRPARRSVVAVLSGAERRGSWRLPRKL